MASSPVPHRVLIVGGGTAGVTVAADVTVLPPRPIAVYAAVRTTQIVDHTTGTKETLPFDCCTPSHRPGQDAARRIPL